MSSFWLVTNVLWQTAGWTMLHFLWIGGLFAVLVAIIDRAVRRCSPEIQYSIAVTQFFVIAIIPCCLFAWNLNRPLETAGRTFTPIPMELEKTAAPASAGPRAGDASPTAVATPQGGADVANIEVEINPTRDDSLEPTGGLAGDAGLVAKHVRSTSTRQFILNVGDTATAWLMTILPWVWVVGFPLTCSTLLIGISGAERLRRQCRILDDNHPAVVICQRLQTVLHLRTRILIGMTDSISAPILVGIIRPLILFPASTLAGISTEQFEMILLHELAHVRRWDNLINLLQRMIEAVLFFHPAVWWLSNRVRLEREHCCDSAVLAHINAPQNYAEMLVQMALANMPSEWVVGTSISHQLIPRIRRILKQEEDRMQVSRKMIVASLSVLLSLVVATVVNAQRDVVKPKEAAPAVAAETKPSTPPAKPDVVSKAKSEGKLGGTHDYGHVQLKGTNLTISGKAVDPDGKPISHVRVYNSGDAEDVVSTMTDDNGLFKLRGLQEGPVYIFAEDPKYRMAGIYTSDLSKPILLTLIPLSAAPAPRPEVNLQALDAIRQQNADQLAEWIKAKNLTFRPNLRDDQLNTLARTDPDEALRQIEKQSTAAEQQSAITIARSLAPDQPRKKDAGDQDAQAIKTALRFVERAASRIGDVSGTEKIYLKADTGLMFLRLGDTERGKALVESAAKDFSESKNSIDHLANDIAQGLAWYDIPRALSYRDKVREQYRKASIRHRVIHEVSRYNVPRALELLTDATLKPTRDYQNDGLQLDLAYRIGKVDSQVAAELFSGIANARTKAEAAGRIAVAVAADNPALARSLIDQGMESLQANRRPPGRQSSYYEYVPGVAANLAVQAAEVKYPDMESLVQRVLSLRIPAHKGNSSASRFQSTANAALYLAFIDPAVAKRLLTDLEPKVSDHITIYEGTESVGINRWLSAWVIADPEHAVVLLKAEMEKPRGDEKPPYWISNAYTLLCLPRTEQLNYVRAYWEVSS